MQQDGHSDLPLRARFDPRDEAEVAESLPCADHRSRGFGRSLSAVPIASSTSGGSGPAVKGVREGAASGKSRPNGAFLEASGVELALRALEIGAAGG